MSPALAPHPFSGAVSLLPERRIAVGRFARLGRDRIGNDHASTVAKGSRRKRAGRPTLVTEALEGRWVMSAAGIGSIPTLVNPNDAPQMLLAAGVANYSMTTT